MHGRLIGVDDMALRRTLVKDERFDEIECLYATQARNPAHWIAYRLRGKSFLTRQRRPSLVVA
jgi:hypothetical protein